MVRYILKRLLQGIFVLLGVSIMIFVLSRVVPGDPGRLALGPRATQEAVDALNEQLYMDKPLPVQYAYWIRDIFNGDFGISIVTKRSVSQDVSQFLPATLELVLVSGVFMVCGALLLGTLAARFKDSFIDGLVRVLSYTGIALPSFVVSILFLLLFGYIWPVIPVLGRLSAGVAPPADITGLYIVDALITGKPAVAWDAFLHLILPALALAFGGMFQDARLLRNALTENAEKEYMQVSKSYGLPRNKLMNKYLMKSSSASVITVMGMDFAVLVGNAFLVEKVFNWPGVSRYGMNAMLNKDLNAICAVVLIIGLVFLVVNLIVDLIIAAIDPRIRLS